MNRLPEIRPSYVGEPARYFHGVARFVAREELRKKEITVDEMPVIPTQVTYQSDEYDCLLKCLKFLTRDRKELILDYYLYKGHDKIEQHRRMASELGISDSALRGRAHQARATLEECISRCIPTADKTKNREKTITM